MTDTFEKALDSFLAGCESDRAHQALYDIIRAAFQAGWSAAGGQMPREQPVFCILPGQKDL